MNNKLFLSDNLSGQKRCFEPCRYDRITIYACGPTVYKVPHLGNFRSFTIFDTLYRFLTYLYPNVIYVRNITDIDDKIIDQARAQNIDPKLLTNSVIESFSMYCEKLNLLPPTFEPKVTDFMNEIIADIQTLIINGFAYEKSHHVMFDTTKYDDYRKFCKDMNTCTGARVEVSVLKNNENDFVLWKPADDFGWDSPWGYGRPGWHIECTSMSRKILGFPFDIHCGGQDLIFPHHENEVAQSCCANGTDSFGNYWLHNGMINMGQQKMSKSLGNILLIKDVAEQYKGEVIRWLLLSAQYRQTVTWSEESIHKSQKTLDRIYATLRDNQSVSANIGNENIPEEVVSALDDDLNTPMAFAEINKIAKSLAKADTDSDKQKYKSQLLSTGNLLGLFQQDPEDWFKSEDIDRDKIEQLIKERDLARANKDWSKSDEIRDQLNDMNIILEDSPEGTRWSVKK